VRCRFTVVLPGNGEGENDERDARGIGKRNHPVNTSLVFEKFADCLAAVERMRSHYADAFEAWDRGAVVNIQWRREYARARELEAKRLLSNVGTCVPHGARACRHISAAAHKYTCSAARHAANFADAPA
jgi:hypothetical protein